MTERGLEGLDWSKGDGLLPAIVQDARSGQVLMLGYMNAEALRETLTSLRVTFYSRSKGRLWRKGETSGNELRLVEVRCDCDDDTLLVLAEPAGPVCHTDTRSCFGDGPLTAAERLAFLSSVEEVIAERIAARPEGSYTVRLWDRGPQRIARKVGEEGLELALAAVCEDDGRVLAETADLLYHMMLLLKTRNLGLADAVAELARRGAASDAGTRPIR